MTEKVKIEYESFDKATKVTELGEVLLDTKSQNGLSWNFYSFADYKSSLNEKHVYLKWKFSWDPKLARNGFVGHVSGSTYSVKHVKYFPDRFPVTLTHSGQEIRRVMGSVDATRVQDQIYFRYAFSLEKQGKETEKVVNPFDNYLNALNNKHNDAVLLVEGQKISVNRNYLTVRSEFFDTLFNSDFKEKSLKEIPISNVKFADFQCLLSLIDPINPSAPTDNNVRILLELADRFLIPAVTRIIENHLLNSTGSLVFFETLELADKYKLETLLEKCVEQFTSMEHIKILNERMEGMEMSDDLCAKLFRKTMAILKAEK